MTNRISPKYQKFSVIIDKDKEESLNPKTLLYVSDTSSPEEVIDKLNDAVQYYGYLGSMKADMEDKVLKLKDNFKIWLESSKDKYDAKSEGALEREVIVHKKKKYKKYKTELRKANYILRRIDITRKTFKMGIEVLRSMRSSLQNEKDLTKDYSIKKSTRSGDLDEK